MDDIQVLFFLCNYVTFTPHLPAHLCLISKTRSHFQKDLSPLVKTVAPGEPADEAKIPYALYVFML